MGSVGWVKRSPKEEPFIGTLIGYGGSSSRPSLTCAAIRHCCRLSFETTTAPDAASN